jgi:predicted transcriptional regulator
MFVRSYERAIVSRFAYAGSMTPLLPFRGLERIVRGFSCHRRIQILALLEQSPQSLSLSQISAACRANIKPVCEHVRRLHLAGLVAKRRSGRTTMHHLTPLGQKIMAFLRMLP